MNRTVWYIFCCICLLSSGVIVSGCQETRTPGEQQKAEGEYRAAALSRGVQLGKAFAQYASDNDDCLPDLARSQDALKPYLPAEIPQIKVPFVPELGISRKKRSEIPNAGEHVLFYEALPSNDDNAPRVVGLVNGDVHTVSGDEWKKLVGMSGLSSIRTVARR
jgi:hypothetical protein